MTAAHLRPNGSSPRPLRGCRYPRAAGPGARPTGGGPALRSATPRRGGDPPRYSHQLSAEAPPPPPSRRPDRLGKRRPEEPPPARRRGGGSRARPLALEGLEAGEAVPAESPADERRAGGRAACRPAPR